MPRRVGTGVRGYPVQTLKKMMLICGLVTIDRTQTQDFSLTQRSN